MIGEKAPKSNTTKSGCIGKTLSLDYNNSRRKDKNENRHISAESLMRFNSLHRLVKMDVK